MTSPIHTVVVVPAGVDVELVRDPCACPAGRVCADGDPFAPICPRRVPHPEKATPMPRTVSPSGRAALMAREGCRLDAYRDSVGVLTIGVGHTGRAGPPPVALGLTLTRAEADAIFAADLAPFEGAVSAAVPATLTQNQYDACVSLAFNIGACGFAGSTVVHKLAGGDHTGAADAFLMWAHPPELAARRRAERAQFLRADDPVPLSPAVAVRPPTPSAPVVSPPMAGPHLLPTPTPTPGFWARLSAALARKAA